MSLEIKRREINRVDRQIRELFVERMEIAREIGEFKKLNGLEVEDKQREIIMIEKNVSVVQDELRLYYKELLEKLIDLSKRYQLDLK
ncbi:MAG: chorismate mutase [Filifactoraceae bacterium]